MSEEWGPVIKHDQMHLPVPVGTVVRRWFDKPVGRLDGIDCEDFTELVSPIHPNEASAWDRTHRAHLFWPGEIPMVTHYQVRQFGAMTELKRLADLPQPADPEVAQ